LVLDDINRSLVSVQGARSYGVVIKEDMSIDQAATSALRAEMSSARGDVKLFDFGGDIADIKARSLTETKLPAPQAPEF
jgi:N-methylhydantoinase B